MNTFLHKWLPRFFYKKFDGGKDSGEKWGNLNIRSLDGL